MNPATADALALFESDGPIPKDRVLGWMGAPDLGTRGVVFSIISEAWDRVSPGLTMDEAAPFGADYLLECLALDQETDDHVMCGFEAGRALSVWLKSLAEYDSAGPILRGVAQRLADMYRNADEKTRNRIETGAVEHILEWPALRPYFAFWAQDPMLKQAHEECMAWGLAHEGGEW